VTVCDGGTAFHLSARRAAPDGGTVNYSLWPGAAGCGAGRAVEVSHSCNRLVDIGLPAFKCDEGYGGLVAHITGPAPRDKVLDKPLGTTGKLPDVVRQHARRGGEGAAVAHEAAAIAAP